MLRRLFLTAACGLALAGGAHAAPATLSPDDKARVEASTAYLQGLATVEAKFTQTAPDGQTSTGVLTLQRPGKARFAYDPPTLMTITSDGKTVYLYDGRLKTVDKAPLSRTPLNILLAQQVRLDKGVKIARVDKNTEGFALTALDSHNESDGRIVLYFATKASGDVSALKGWNLTDAQGRTTKVRLGELTAKSGLDPALFMAPKR
ncbi:outer membrane lipoprotein carrier protein LolA [soil metagenome]